MTAISRDLKEASLIRSPLAFQFSVIAMRGEHSLAAGDYYFSQPISAFEIAQRLTGGKFFLEPVKITLAEGLTASQMADILSEKLRDFNREEFLKLALPEEGRLFPDTYFWGPAAPADEVIKTIRQNYERRLEPLRPEIAASGRAESDILVMASIIEREAGGIEEMPIIAGILWKRLEKKIPLQADAAPVTYKQLGLPEKPIANPGLNALRAALRPEESAYFYYLHDKDGEIHYAKTLIEHNANKRKYLK